jgi:hypothetical protein
MRGKTNSVAFGNVYPLHAIPLLKNLFRTRADSQQDIQVFVVVVPRILSSGLREEVPLIKFPDALNSVLNAVPVPLPTLTPLLPK